MGLQDVQVPRAGEWRWEGPTGIDGAYMLISPTGAHAGTWWPEAAPDGMYQRLTDIAAELNERDNIGPRCPLCRGDVTVAGMCTSCAADHR